LSSCDCFSNFMNYDVHIPTNILVSFSNCA
jgi:hypothetical protein